MKKLGQFLRLTTALIVVAAVLMAPVIAQAGKGGALKQQVAALQAEFVGKQIVAKIDLPVVRSLYVFPNGDFDEQRYYKRVKKFPPRLVRGDRAELRKLVVEKDRIALCINRCGLPKMAVSGGTKYISGGKKAGARIEIEFGRPVTADDLRTEVVLAAVANVIDIEGVSFAPAAPTTATQTASGAAWNSGAQPVAELLSAEVEPTEVRPGETVALIAHFEVSGVVEGELPVTLVRQLSLDDAPLLSPAHSETGSWANGRHSSRMEMPVPASAGAGVYSFEITLRGGAVEERKTALFVVSGD